MANYTTITGIVKDPTGNIYQNGAFSFTFFDPGTSGKLPTFANGQTFQTTIGGSLDSFGFFTVQVPDNGTIASASGATGTSWNFEFCANGNILKLPAGAPVPCFTYSTVVNCSTNTPTTCTANTIAITAQVQAVAASLGGTGITATNLSGPGSISGSFSGTPTLNSLWTFSSGITGTGSIGALTASYATLTSFPAGCGANQFATQIGATPGCTQPSFSNLLGTVASAQYGSQSANTFLAAPSGSSGNPTFRTVLGADLPAINLAASGAGGVTGNLPVSNFNNGTGATATTLWHGNATWSSVDLANDVVGNLPVLRLASGSGATANTLWHGNATWAKVDLTNDTASSLPVASIAPGINGQCINTSGTAATWGSCAGTAGVQTLTADGVGLQVNANTAIQQNLKSYTIGAGVINAVGKTVRIHAGGTFTPVNTTETVQFITNGPGGISPSIIFTPTSTLSGFWVQDYLCTVTNTGVLGGAGCTGRTEAVDGAGVSHVTVSSGGVGINTTIAQTIQFTVTFSTASASNIAVQQHMVVELMN